MRRSSEVFCVFTENPLRCFGGAHLYIVPMCRMQGLEAATNSLLSLDKILYSSEINNLRDFLSWHSVCYEFKPCSVLCGFGLASSFGCFTLARFC
jgi:hypothetical protein